MSIVQIDSRITQKHDTEQNWNLVSNFIPLNGEIIIYDADENYSYPRVKCGDGSTLLKNLPFIVDVESILRKIDLMAPLPDIETSDDVVLKLTQLSNQIDTLTSTINTLDTMVNSLIPAVGEVYMTFSEENPSIKFGGVWEQIKDTFLLACGDTWAAGASGGEATHILSIEELPAHGHDFLRHQLWRTEEDPIDSTVDDGYGVSNKTLSIYRDTTELVGGVQAHNNMPPYTTVYVWKRIG